jgi:CDP-2,3-bis-(O-geranylgeranyl)-sn-glycerol synthase
MAEALTAAVRAVWLLLPAYAANVAPVFAARWRLLESLNRPVDGGRVFLGKPLFGAHKTWRGFVAGALSGAAVVLVQARAYDAWESIRDVSLFDYTTANWARIGLLMGVGALLGDLVKSFFKRRAGVPPGKDWIPFDQLDFVIGAFALLSFEYKPAFPIVIAGLIVSPLGHVAVNWIGRSVGIKK